MTMVLTHLTEVIHQFKSMEFRLNAVNSLLSWKSTVFQVQGSIVHKLTLAKNTVKSGKRAVAQLH